ncbi:MAG: hypothetical protein JXQ96_06375 [Cyclobacteriaceae bacterium]
MKKSIFGRRLTLGALCILILSINSAIAQDNSIQENRESLIGTWALDYNKSIDQIDSSSKTHYDGLSNEKKNRIADSFTGRKMIFGEDGTYTLQLNRGMVVSGTWELTDELTILIGLDGKQFEQKIISISSSEMLLNLGGDQSKNRLFRKWYLNKVKN